MSDYNETRILEILQSVLGHATQIKNEYKFNCPWCHHHKPKLQLNIASQKWNCWTCAAKGRSLYFLVKKLNAPKTMLDTLSKYLGNVKYDSSVLDEDEEPLILLPREFIPLHSISKDIDYNLASAYLRRRNILYEDIVKYNIGFCSDGMYRGRIIIPSYSSNKMLNYFIARSYYPYETFKYKNPPISKNIIGFDLQINWHEEITICEGVFDAISIKRNAIPLLGKNIPIKLHEKLMMENVKNITIALDTDAKKEALWIANRYMKEGVNVKLISLEGKDPSEIGFETYNALAEKSDKFGFSELIREKLYG